MNFELIVTIVVVQAIFVACTKRLVLHSDQDIATQLSSMQARISQLETRLGHVEVENQHLKSTQGFAAGNHNNDYGGGVNTLCLPGDPTWNKYNDKSEDWTGRLYATEIDAVDTPMLLGTNYHNQDVPCAMCKTPRSSSIMIPGRTNCYPGWSLEYTGYLMSGYHGLKSNTDYICLDAHPEGVPHGGGDDNEHVMYFTEATCTSLSCPPYINGRELACVVCSQ